MRKTMKLSLLAAAVAVFALLAMPAQAATLASGSDIFVTGGGGGTTVDLSQFPIAAAFGDGATVSPSLVSLKGQPIAGLGQTDTVVERLSDVVLDAPGDTGTTAIELKGLRLVSERAVAINRGGSVTHWNLEVGLSPSASSNGTMTIQLNSGGGTFDTIFNVIPRLRFSRTGEADVIIDCGTDACAAMELSSSNSYWADSGSGFNPGAAGVPNIANGTAFDGDGDGIKDDVLRRGSRFHPGFDPVTHDPVPLSHDHPPVAEHQQGPNIQCADDATVEEEPEVIDAAGPTATFGEARLVTAKPALCPAVATPAEPTTVE